MLPRWRLVLDALGERETSQENEEDVCRPWGRMSPYACSSSYSARLFLGTICLQIGSCGEAGFATKATFKKIS